MGKASVIAILTLCLFRLDAATWYASATGSATNGTLSAPWSVLYSVTNSAGNPHLQPGDTVLFLDGETHTCLETNSYYSVGNVLNFKRAGLPGLPITYRPQTLWGFSFDGGLMINSATHSASNITLWGLRVFSNLTTNRTLTNSTGYYIPSGITEDSPGNSILHCLIENVGHPGIASWKGTRGKNIRGNIIRFCGIDDWILFSGGNRGSGMYLQNADNSSEALIGGNISFFNYTTGMKAYGNTDIWKFRFTRNIMLQNAEAGIFYHLDNYASSNLVISTNFAYRNGTGIRIGYPLGNGGHSNAVVTKNYSVDGGYSAYPFYLTDGWRSTTWSNNVGVSLSNRYVFFLEVLGELSGDVSSHRLGGNSYYSTNTGVFGSGPFFIKETSKSLAQWQSDTSSDADAVQSYTMPTDLVKEIFNPSDDVNFAHVIVFNWALSNSTTIAVNGLFQPGDSLNIYDVQNIPTPCSSVIWDGQSEIPLNLSLTNRAAMNGRFAQRTDGVWSGLDANIRAFVIYRSGTAGSRSSKLRGLRVR